jgi:XTP/dITP diphosphohydrolase
VEWESSGALGLAAPEEIHNTFLENALLKARKASQASGRPALADDSGLLVDALFGAPGVWSADFFEQRESIAAHFGLALPRLDSEAAARISRMDRDAANRAWLLAMLDDVSVDERGAEFVCVLVGVRSHNDPLPMVSMGRWRGSIAMAERGNAGFGYDRLFVDRVSGVHAAEMSLAEKHDRGHRGQALRGLSQWFCP